MSVGFPLLKTDIDARSGSLVVQLRDTFEKIRLFKLVLDGFAQDSDLIALGYNQADVTLLRASFTDLDKLRQVGAAAATQASTSDFWFNAKKLAGVN
jgi:hypothetical protein